MYWQDVVNQALRAAQRGDRDTFELLLDSRNRKLDMIRDALREAGEAILDRPIERPAPPVMRADHASVTLALVAQLLGIGLPKTERPTAQSHARMLEGELTKRIIAAHPDRTTTGSLSPEDLTARLTEVSTAYTGLLIILRNLVRSA
jgi:hypothetical protein